MLGPILTPITNAHVKVKIHKALIWDDFVGKGTFWRQLQKVKQDRSPP